MAVKQFTLVAVLLLAVAAFGQTTQITVQGTGTGGNPSNCLACGINMGNGSAYSPSPISSDPGNTISGDWGDWSVAGGGNNPGNAQMAQYYGGQVFNNLIVGPVITTGKAAAIALSGAFGDVLDVAGMAGMMYPQLWGACGSGEIECGLAFRGRASIAKMRESPLEGEMSWMTFGHQTGNHLVDRLEHMEAGVTGRNYPELSPGLMRNAEQALDKWEAGGMSIHEIIYRDAALRRDFVKFADSFADPTDGEKWRFGLDEKMTPEFYKEYGLFPRKTLGYMNRIKDELAPWNKRTGD